MNIYNAYYKGKEIEVKANTSLEAQNIAAKEFKAKKSYEVSIILAMRNGVINVLSTSQF